MIKPKGKVKAKDQVVNEQTRKANDEGRAKVIIHQHLEKEVTVEKN